MRIEVRFKDEVAVMKLTGRFLAGSDGPFLRQKVKELIEAGTRMLVIDFAGVPYIDSTGLGFLAGSRVTTQNAGAKMVLAGVNPPIKNILSQVRLSQFFEMADDVDAAAAKAMQLAKAPGGAAASPPKEPKGTKRSAGQAEG